MRALLASVPCLCVCSGLGTCDLTTPFTDAPRGTALVQLSSSSSGELSPEASYLNWPLLYYTSGNRAVLEDKNSGLGTLLVTSLSLLIVLCCACSLGLSFIEAVPEPGALGAPGAGVSARPSLAKSRQTTQPPSIEDASSPRRYSQQLTCCPDLVVPRGQQSLVGLPYHTEGEGVLLLDVVDPIGMPLLKAEVDRSLLNGRSEHEPFVVLRNLRPEARGSLLRSPKRGFVDTSALAVVYKNGPELDICLPDNSIFASLVKEDVARYVLKTGPEEVTSLTFLGPVKQLRVLDSQQRLVAQSSATRLRFESEREFYSLESRSGSDVGLLLCCLMCIDALSR